MVTLARGVLRLRLAAFAVGSVLLYGCTPTAPIQRTDHEEWESVQLDNGLVQAVVVPGIARVMAFRRSNGPDLFWRDPGLHGDEPNMSTDQFQNFGGSKLWVAPQTAWGRDWPPTHAAVDRGACTSSFAPDGTLRVSGMACPVAGVRMDRRLTLEPDTPVLHLEYTMQNTTTSNVAWGIWQIIQVQPGGRVLIPAPKGTRVWNSKEEDYLRHWKRAGDVLVLHHTDQNGKIGAISPEGWVAYEKDGEVLVLSFPADVSAEYPDGHGSHEVYSNSGYIELEHVAPLAHLAPGETATTSERWILFSLNGSSPSDAELAARIRDACR